MSKIDLRKAVKGDSYIDGCREVLTYSFAKTASACSDGYRHILTDTKGRKQSFTKDGVFVKLNPTGKFSLVSKVEPEERPDFSQEEKNVITAQALSTLFDSRVFGRELIKSNLKLIEFNDSRLTSAERKIDILMSERNNYGNQAERINELECEVILLKSDRGTPFVLFDEEMKATPDESLDFNTWWEEEGLVIKPTTTEELHEFMERVANIAWSNGEYKALKEK